MKQNDTVALTSLPRELAELTGAPAPGYRRLYNMAVDARIPVEQVNGRWRVRRTDLPGIAAQIGLPARATVAA